LDREGDWSRVAYAGLLVRRGATSDALDELSRVGAADASAPTMASVLAAVYFFARQYDRVIDICSTVIDSTGGAPECQYWMGRALLSKGRAAEALLFLQKRRPGGGQGFGSVAAAYLAAGRRAEALRIRAEAERRAVRTYVSPVSLAQTYFAFG
jgi:predicted Zn-dependent protease